jgi:predicted DNA-binding WGR domain protein
MNNHALTPVSVPDARALMNRGLDWRVRVVYVGENLRNASGKSDKWWEASGDGGPDATVRWGASGSRGQAQATTAADAIDRANGKIRKGYVLDSAVRSVRRASVPMTVQDLVNRGSWKPLTTEQALFLGGQEGLIAIDVGTADLHGLRVQTLFASDGALWGFAPDNGSILTCCLRRLEA